MKRTNSPFYARRTSILTLLSFVAVAALVTFGVSARRGSSEAARVSALRATNNRAESAPAGKALDQDPNAPQAAVIVATLTDNITAATKVAPGANINYTATITNNGAATPADDAINLNFSAPLDANTTLVAGSIHASPIAFNDTYNWVGNTFLDSSARALPPVTTNDVAVNAPAGTDTFNVTTIAGGATALGGVVSLAANGHYTYTPPLGRPNIGDGATVQDSFTYTITNNTDPTLTSTGTVRINLTGRVWYLVAGGVGDGRSGTPSGSPSAMSTAADKSTDVFYIFSNAGNLNGLFTIETGQQLLGQGVNLVVNTITLFTAGAPPTHTDAAGNGVTLGMNNTLAGFNIGNCSGIAIFGSNVGTLVVNTLSINTTGAGLDLTGSGNPAVSVVLGGLTSSGGTKNVNLVSLGGTVTLGTGALSGATGTSFDVGTAVAGSGGTAAVTYSGTIAQATASQRPVSVQRRTGGTVGFSANITANTGTVAGIFLDQNGGSTINFTGGLNLNTGANAAFTATGGGTVSATQDNTTIVNTLTTTTGAALNIASTTIGASGLTFRSISVTGNNTLPTNGIILNATGTGALKVSGNAGTCTPATPTCTGGTIQGTGSHGVSLTSVSNIEFNLMSIHDTGDRGITGTTVNNFILRDCRIFNFDNGAHAPGATVDAMHFTNLTGTVTIQRNTIGPDGQFVLSPFPPLPENKGIIVRNTNVASLAMTVTGTTFTQLSNDGIDAEATGGTGTISVDGSTVDGANVFDQINGRSVNFGAPIDNASARVLDLTVKNNTFASVGIGGRWFAPARTTMNARFNNNTMSGTSNDAIRSEADAADATLSPKATVNATINGNNMGGGGIFISNHRQAIANIALTNNPGIGFAGINVNSDRGSTIGIDITGNNVSVNGASPLFRNAMYLQTSNNGGGASTTCANISGNVLTSTGATSAGVVLDTVNGEGTIGLEGYVSGPEETYLTSVNTITGSPQVAIDNPAFVNVGGNCVTSTPIAPPADEGARNRIDTSNNSVYRASAPVTLPTIVNPAVAKSPTPVAAMKQVALIGNNSLAVGKAIPRASAAEVARIYRSEAPLSHHAVRRHLNASSQQPNAPTSGEVVSLNTIATFPAAGKSITIRYAATVNTPPTATQASTQGTVSGGNFASVLTDDPDAAGSANPTITLIETGITWTGVLSTDWNTPGNWVVPGPVVSTYAPGVANTVNDVTIPTAGVTNEPTLSASPITVHSLDLQSGRTLIITGQTLTISGTSGSNLTVNGVINGGSLLFAINGVYGVSGAGSLTSNNVTTVGAGATVTLNSNLQMGHLVINGTGTADITNRTLSLSGGGAPALTVTGTLTTTGSTVVLNGTAAQTIAGITYNNLTINNTIGAHVTGVTLQGNATVNGALTLTSSDLATGAFTLTMPVAATSGPASGATDVVGNVTRTGFVSGGGALSFGNPFNTIRINSGAAPANINVLLAKNAPVTYAAAVLRSYTITPSGASGPATLRLHYRQAELNGNSETPPVNFNLRRGPNWGPAIVPTSRIVGVVEDNWLENNAVTTFSEWTMSNLAPTAAGGAVTGRIVADDGTPVEGAVVRLSGAQNRKFITDANGFYRFDNVETNGFYNVTPARVNYTFSPAVIAFSQIGESTNATFGASATGGNINPLDTPEYYVRQHYLDFLGREPEEAGFNFWSDQILGCGDDTDCVDRRRINVSAAYFLSIEFQETGGLVDGVYRASYGRRPSYGEFRPDAGAIGRGVIVGTDGWQGTLLVNKAAFLDAFVQRAAFQTVYGGLSNDAYVDALIANTGVSFTTSERADLVSGLAGGDMTRAGVLRAIAENGQFVAAKRNQAFVMMEYFGYLRREPDADGYQFWLHKLNEFNGNFEQAEMVKSFIISGEYRQRFPR